MDNADKLPTLSVGIPNFNHGRYLRGALDALLAQSYRPLEIIVIDDGSTDGSIDILRDYASRHPHLRYIVHESNRGVNATQSELLELATGDYFFGPAADDLVLPGILEKSMALLEKHPAAGICSAQSRIIDENGNDEGFWGVNPVPGSKAGYYIPPDKCAAILLRQKSWITGNNVIFRRQALLEVGGYRSALGSYSDAFANQVLALKHGACFIPEPLASWRRLATSYSSRSNRDPARMSEIREAVLHAMTAEFSDIFSQTYIRRWKGRWNFGRVLYFSSYKSREWRDGLEKCLLPGGLRNRLLFVFCVAIGRLLWTTIKIAAVPLLIPFDMVRIVRYDIWQALRHRKKGLLV